MRELPIIHEIEGKKIKDYINLPYGQFEKLARKIDPHWNKGDGSLKPVKWVVKIEEEITTHEMHTLTVLATDEEEAEAMALDDVEDLLDCYDNEHYVHSIELQENES